MTRTQGVAAALLLAAFGLVMMLAATTIGPYVLRTIVCHAVALIFGPSC